LSGQHVRVHGEPRLLGVDIQHTGGARQLEESVDAGRHVGKAKVGANAMTSVKYLQEGAQSRGVAEGHLGQVEEHQRAVLPVTGAEGVNVFVEQGRGGEVKFTT